MCMPLPYPCKTFNKDGGGGVGGGVAEFSNMALLVIGNPLYLLKFKTGFCNGTHNGAGIKRECPTHINREWTGLGLQTAVGTLPGKRGLVCVEDSVNTEEVCLLLRDNTGVACIHHICVCPIGQNSGKLDM